ncbi:GMC family oxidoreductase N-terminal domain-containing protein [Streptomyces sp. NPDC058439]|uniref:GMC family oxidoreductase N-terminal domain-containing protein n=1 Tax=Streptomyces sp. NPDC058439 TaxID=3346500 RepID=UPI00365D7A2C
MLAARLSEDSGRSVCLVEAGPDYGANWRAWPARTLNARALPRDDVWERHSAVHRIRGRVLGGSSCINGCWNTWGCEEDHAEWVHAGDARWSQSAMEPYRLRAVEQMRLRAVPECEYSPWSRAALEAAAELGYEEVDTAAPGRPGYGAPLLNASDGVRWNAAFAHLEAARSRPNLTILSGTTVDRLNIRGGSVRAADVLVDGRVQSLVADTYVAACGTFGSPALLLRSGIGPADHLRELGVRPAVDLPGVGANLIDQPGVFVPLVPTAELNTALAAKEEAGELYVSRMLIRAASGLSSGGSWDLHILPSAGDPLFVSLSPGQYEAGISAFLMKPASRGNLRLRSADPAVPPEIGPAFLTLKKACQILDEMYVLGVRYVDFTGGEPVLHPHIDGIVQYAKSLGMAVEITSNGIRFAKHIDAIVPYVDTMNVSLDTLRPDRYQKIRGVPTLDRALDVIRRIAATGADNLKLICVVTRENRDEVPDLLRFAHDNRFTIYFSGMFEYFDEQDTVRDVKRTARKLKLIEQNGKPLADTSATRARRLDESEPTGDLISAELMRLLYQPFALLNLHFRKFMETLDPTAPTDCYANKRILTVGPDGRLVLPCYHAFDNSVVWDRSLTEMVQDEEFLRVRDEEVGHRSECRGTPAARSGAGCSQVLQDSPGH